MNLFATSPCPEQSAKNLDDKRLNKMITETAQMICTILRDDGVKNLPFKSTHANHPVVKWAAETSNNLYWLRQHHYFLYQEWRYRFNKKHGSWLGNDILEHIPTAKPPKSFLNYAKNDARELDYRWVEDVHLAYQLYLNARWLNDTREPHWTDPKKKPNSFIGHRGPGFSTSFIGTSDNEAIFDLLIQRTQSLIGRSIDGSIPCPHCGGKLKFKNKDHFRCVQTKCDDFEGYPCLMWERGK